MRLILFEMKKIWSVRLLMGVLLLSGMVYSLVMSYRVVPTGHDAIETHNFMLSMTQEFGPTLEEDEFEETGAWLDDLYRQADEIVRTDSRITPLGFQSYSQMREALDNIWESEEYDYSDPEYQAIDEAHWLIFGSGIATSEYEFLGFRIQALEGIREAYVYEMSEGNGYTGIMPDTTLHDYTFPYTGGMLMLIVLVVTAMLAPTLTRDRMARVDMLQLSSKRGRRVYHSQLWAMLISAFVIITVLMTLFTFILVHWTGLGILWNNPLNSFFRNSMPSEIDLTLGQYYLIIIGFAYALGLGVALAMFCFSGTSRHYVSLLVKAIPLFVVAGVFAGAMLAWSGLFTQANTLRIFGESLLEPVVPLIVFIAGGGIACWFLRSRRYAEV